MLSGEFRKIWLSKIFLLLILISLSINAAVLVISTNDKKDVDFHMKVEEKLRLYETKPEIFLEEYEDIRIQVSINEKKVIEEIKKEGFNIMGFDNVNGLSSEENNDLELYDTVLGVINQQESYKSKITDVMNKAKYQLSNTTENAFLTEYNEQILEKYSNLYNFANLSNEYVYGWDTLLNYSSSDYLVILCVCVMSSLLIGYETQTGFIVVQSVCKFGRNKVKLCKILTGFISVSIVHFAFSIESILIIFFRSGLSSPFSHIQSINDYILCPMNTNILLFYLYIGFVKLLLFYFLLMTFMTINIYVSNTLIAFLLNLSYCAINYLARYRLARMPFSPLRFSNFFYIMNTVNLLGKYNVVGILNHSVSALRYVIALFTFAITICFMLALIKRISKRKKIKYYGLHEFKPEPIYRLLNKTQKHNKKENTHRRIQSISLIRSEYYKTWLSHYSAIFLILIIVFKIIMTYSNCIEHRPYYDQVYYDYMTSLSGEITEEKLAYLSKERMRINNSYADFTTAQDRYIDGEITYTQYAYLISEYKYALVHAPALNRIEKQISNIHTLESQGKSGYLIYDSGWNILFLSSFDYCGFLSIILLYSSVFSSEYEKFNNANCIAQIIRCCKYGRKKTFYCKMYVLILGSISISILMFVIQLITVKINYSLQGAFSPIHSIQTYSEIEFNASIFAFLIIRLSVNMLLYALLALFVFSISEITKNTILTVVIIHILYLFPYVISEYIFNNIVSFLSCSLFSADAILTRPIEGTIFLSVVIIIDISLTLFAKRLWC